MVSMQEWAKDPDATAEKIAKGIWNQIQFSKLFNGPQILFGFDSNSEFVTHEAMKQWQNVGIVLNIGKAGSRFDTWTTIFKTVTGQRILAYVKQHKVKIFVNLGGNHLLQSSMDNLESSMLEFISLFGPDQQFIAADLPDIMVPILAPLLNMTEDQLRTGVDTCNQTLMKHFPYFIKLGDYFADMDKAQKDSGLILEAEQNVLGDMLVHYSDPFNIQHRIPYYAKIAKQVFGL